MGEKNSNVLEMMLQKKESERKELQHENEILQKRLKEFESAYNLCQQTKDELTKELFQAEDRIDQLQELVNKGSFSENLEEFQEKYYNLEKRYESLMEQTKDDETTNMELMEQLKETQKLSTGKDKVINDLNQQLAKANVQIITSQKETKRLNDVVNKNEKELTEANREKDELNAEILQIAGQIDKLNAELGIKKSETEEKEQTLGRIKIQTADLLEEKRKYVEDVKKLKKELEDAKSENEEFQMEYEMLQEEFEKCKDTIEGRREKLEHYPHAKMKN